jgi:hypothetical protein
MIRLEEQHQREQYFFDEPTLGELCPLIAGFTNPCCLCAPTVAAALHKRGRDVAALDVDRRFAALPRFLHWDLYRPERLEQRFDMVFCDPPFFAVSLSQLFRAIRLLAGFDLSVPVAISYLARREAALLSVFGPMGLRPTGYAPGYRTVRRCAKNDIRLYANVDAPLWTAAQKGPGGRLPCS